MLPNTFGKFVIIFSLQPNKICNSGFCWVAKTMYVYTCYIFWKCTVCQLCKYFTYWTYSHSILFPIEKAM